MALTDKLHALDHNFFPGTRDAEEDAETFLRRVAASRAISPAQAGDVMAALREYFGVEPQVKGNGGETGEGAEAGEQKDEASEEKSDSNESDGERESDDGESESDTDKDE